MSTEGYSLIHFGNQNPNCLSLSLSLAEKQREEPEMELLDSLSNLPSEIVENILELLPIKEAMRTSILSTKWRYRPAMIKILKFDEECVSTQKSEPYSTFAHIVDQVLLHHIGPIRTFVLSHKHFSPTADIDRWILHLSRSSVKSLVLEIMDGDGYKLPSCLFSCQDIIYLWLSNCILKPPSTFRGFKSLERLGIWKVTLTQNVLEDLIVRCSMLKRLHLMDLDGCKSIHIDAPNLTFFYLKGDFEDVILQNTLNVVSVDMDLVLNHSWVVGSSSNLLKFFVHLPNICDLELAGYSLKYLAVGPLLAKLPQPLLYLKVLNLDVDFTDVEEISTALCLVRSSPALQRLDIWACEVNRVVGEADSWFENLGNKSDCQLAKLQRIDIAFSSLGLGKAVLDFIKFLLLSSPVLEYMTLKPVSVDGSLELLKEVVRFRRASVQAEIVVLDP